MGQMVCGAETTAEEEFVYSEEISECIELWADKYLEKFGPVAKRSTIVLFLGDFAWSLRGAIADLEGQPVIESEWQQLVRERDEALSRAAKYAARADKAIDLARRLEKVNEAALAKIKEMREWGNDGEYGEGYYDAVDEIERALTGRE